MVRVIGEQFKKLKKTAILRKKYNFVDNDLLKT